MDADLKSIDTLKFQGMASYKDRLKNYQDSTGLTDAVIGGHGMLDGYKVALAVMDFGFLAATMGSVVGERITRVIEYGTAERAPVVIVSASGGARMYEGMLSLMQMAKTSGALTRHAEQRLPYISVLTNPTTAGVMASFASLGDVIIAEPKSMIGFAGPRVIHVAGTNGKGSVCAMIDSIARARGYRTGLFTSPHLISFRERIRIAGQMISDTDVALGLTKIRALIEKWEPRPTFFEVATAVALQHFAANKIDILILETGLGGRLDATNAVQSNVSVITAIDL